MDVKWVFGGCLLWKTVVFVFYLSLCARNTVLRASAWNLLYSRVLESSLSPPTIRAFGLTVPRGRKLLESFGGKADVEKLS